MLHYKTIEPSTLELLKDLQQLPELANTRLVGGTALALQFGHRTSVDIDLFGNLNVSITEVTHILADFQNFKPISESKAILTCILNDVKVDIVNVIRIRGYNSLNLRNGYSTLEIRSPKDLINYED